VIFDHLDDPWGFDSPLAEVDDVRARGRRIQIRRRLSALGATATAVVVMMGGASMAMGGGGGGDATIVTEASPGRRTAETSVADADTTVTTVAAAVDVPAEVAPTTVARTSNTTPRPPASGEGADDPSPDADPAPEDPVFETPAPTPDPAPGGPTTVKLAVLKDATINRSAGDRNFGATSSLHVRGSVAGLVGFNFDALDPASVTHATLRLTICYTPGNASLCPDASSWPADGGVANVHKLPSGADNWSAGTSNTWDSKQNGSGAGTTWNCGIDATVTDEKADCVGNAWSNGKNTQGQGPARPASTPLVSNMADRTTIEFDVTADVQTGLGTDGTNISWFVRDLTDAGIGRAYFYSAEGASLLGTAGLAPQLIITQS